MEFDSSVSGNEQGSARCGGARDASAGGLNHNPSSDKPKCQTKRARRHSCIVDLECHLASGVFRAGRKFDAVGVPSGGGKGEGA